MANRQSISVFSVKDLRRLWASIDRRGDDDCWLWTAALDTAGYGQLRLWGRLALAHRAVFASQQGWWPPVVMHSCDNPPCCNPRHLLDGTKALNNADKMQKGRFKPSYGDANGMRRHPERAARGNQHYARQRPELLPRGEKHGMAKLTTQKVAEIKALFASNARTKASIARQFNISQSHVGRILNGENWS